MYSYDRRKVARRTVEADLEAAQEIIETTRYGIPIVTQYIRNVEEVFRIMDVRDDEFLNNAKELLKAITTLSKDLGPVLEDVDQLDDTLDGYARHIRRSLPQGHGPVTVKDLDQKVVKDLQNRAQGLKKKVKALSALAKDAPAGYLPVDEFHNSPKVEAINEVVDELETLSTDILFIDSDIVDFLDNVKDHLIKKINGG